MSYYIGLATVFAIYAILGVSLNLVVGYTGLLSVTHAAFFGIGGYAAAILLTRSQISFFAAVPIAMAVTAGAALAIGFVLSRFKDDYYALGSLGFNVIIVTALTNWESLTQGAAGIPSIPAPSAFGYQFGDVGMLALSLAFLVVVFAVSRFLVGLPFGRVLKAIREDEEAIEVFGYRVLSFKLTIFVVSAAMAAMAGTLIASYVTYIDPTSFGLLESILILVIVIVGGLANLWGSLIGALILVLLPEALRFVGMPPELASQMREFIYGFALVALMLFRPQGLLGEYKI